MYVKTLILEKLNTFKYNFISIVYLYIVIMFCLFIGMSQFTEHSWNIGRKH